MTSVPKPLKFLSPLFDKIKEAYEGTADPTLKVSEVALLIRDRGAMT